MDFDESKIDELLKITKENNKILRWLRSMQRWNSFFSFLYWIIILGSVLGVFYYFQPIIQEYANIFHGSVDVIKKFKDEINPVPPNINTVKKLLGN